MLFEDHKTLIMRSKCPDCEMQLKGCLVPLCWWYDGCLECLRSGSACEVEGVPEASTKSFWLNSAGSWCPQRRHGLPADLLGLHRTLPQCIPSSSSAQLPAAYKLHVMSHLPNSGWSPNLPFPSPLTSIWWAAACIFWDLLHEAFRKTLTPVFWVL